MSNLFSTSKKRSKPTAKPLDERSRSNYRNNPLYYPQAKRSETFAESSDQEYYEEPSRSVKQEPYPKKHRRVKSEDDSRSTYSSAGAQYTEKYDTYQVRQAAPEPKRVYVERRHTEPATRKISSQERLERNVEKPNRESRTRESRDSTFFTQGYPTVPSPQKLQHIPPQHNIRTVPHAHTFPANAQNQPSTQSYNATPNLEEWISEAQRRTAVPSTNTQDHNTTAPDTHLAERLFQEARARTAAPSMNTQNYSYGQQGQAYRTVAPGYAVPPPTSEGPSRSTGQARYHTATPRYNVPPPSNNDSNEFTGPKRSDYLRTLGISSGASLAELKKAYRRKALATHPDKHPEKLEEFQKVNEAYEALLKDPEYQT